MLDRRGPRWLTLKQVNQGTGIEKGNHGSHSPVALASQLGVNGRFTARLGRLRLHQQPLQSRCFGTGGLISLTLQLPVVLLTQHHRSRLITFQQVHWSALQGLFDRHDAAALELGGGKHIGQEVRLCHGVTPNDPFTLVLKTIRTAMVMRSWAGVCIPSCSRSL
jgi:hypothetical protein